MKLPTHLLGMVAALAIALLLWLLWPAPRPQTRNEGAAAVEAQAPRASAPALAADLVGAAGPAEAPLAGAEEVGPASARGRALAGAETATLESTEFATTLEIQVIEKSSGAPVEGVAVHTLEFDRSAPLPWDWTQALGSEGLTGLLERHGEFGHSDRQGRLCIPLPASGLWVLARGQGLVGTSGATLTNPLRIELEPAPALTVRVRDAMGQLRSGVTVGLAPTAGSNGSAGLKSLLTSAVTAGDPPGASLPIPSAWRGAGGSGVSVVLAVGLFREPLQKALDPDAGPGEELELVLPPVGSVVVKLAGDTPSDSWPKSLQLARADGSGPRLPLTLVDGHFRSDFVELGQRLVLLGESASGQPHDAPELLIFEGPSNEQPVVEVVLEVPEVPLLAGVALDQDGNPLARHRLEFTAVEAAGFSFGRGDDLDRRLEERESMPLRETGREPNRLVQDWLCWAQTDAAGRFEVRALWLPKLEQSIAAGEVAQVAIKAQRGARAGGQLQLPASAFLEAGLRLDLGAMRLQQLALLVSGRVVDSAGRPVSGQLSCLPIEHPAADGGQASHSGNSTFWQGEVVELGLDGCFEFRGVTAHPLVRLEFRGPSHFQAGPTIVPVGSADQRLLVSGQGSLVFGLLPPKSLDPSICLAHLAPVLFPIEPNGAPTTPLFVGSGISLDPDGRIRIRAVPAGNYRLEFSLASLRLPACDQPSITVTSAQTLDLGTLDLTHRLQVLELRTAAGSDSIHFSQWSLDTSHATNAALIHWSSNGSPQSFLIAQELPPVLTLQGPLGPIEVPVTGSPLEVSVPTD